MSYINLPRDIQTHIASFIPLETAGSFARVSKLFNEIVNGVVQKNLDREFSKLPKDHILWTKREFQVLPKSHLLSFLLAEKTSPGNAERYVVNQRVKELRETSLTFGVVLKCLGQSMDYKEFVLKDKTYEEYDRDIIFHPPQLEIPKQLIPNLEFEIGKNA